MKEERLLLKICLNKKKDKLKPFSNICFQKDVLKSQFEVYFDYTRYKLDRVLWDNIQRDIILHLTEDYATSICLNRQTDENIMEFDDNIGSIYPYKRNSNNEVYIQVPMRDRRLIVKLIFEDTLWSGGNVTRIVAFSENVPMWNEKINECMLENSEFIFQEINDDVGFSIYVNDMKKHEKRIEDTINKILDSYQVVVEKRR